MKNRGSAVYQAAYPTTHHGGRQGGREQASRRGHEPGRRGRHRVAEHRTPPEATPGTAAAPRPLGGRRPDRGTGAWWFTLPVGDASVPTARRTVRDLLRWAPLPEDLRHAALLIVSELVTNAVRHAARWSREIGVEVRLDGRQLLLAVADGHPHRPTALAVAPGHEHTGGRGLLLVTHLAAEAGGGCETERTPSGGKVIRVTLPLPAGR